MRHRIAAALLAALAFVGMSAQDAQAYDVENLRASCSDGVKDNGEPWESMCYALPPAHPSRFVLVGPRYVWHMRVVAAFVEDKVPGVRIYRRLGLTCASYPSATCITIDIDDYGPTGWAGRWTRESWTSPQFIRLNTYYRPDGDPRRRRTAGHELMHALGFTHHIRYGIVGRYDLAKTLPRFPQPVEIDVMRAWYGQEAHS